MNRAAAILLAGLLAACGDPEGGGAASGSRESPADAVVSEAVLGPVRGRLRLEAGPMRFGDRRELRLQVEAGPDARLVAAELPARIGHFRVRGHRIASLDERTWDVVFSIEAERTGRNVGRYPAIFFDATGGEGAATRGRLDLPVFEAMADPAPGDLAGELEPVLAAVADPLPLPSRRRAPAGLAGAVLAALLLGGGLLWWRRSRGGTDGEIAVLSPEDEARAALDRLLAGGLLSRGEFGEFYVRLTGIVRRFIERTTGIDAPDRTTEEFLQEISGRTEFPAGRRLALERFLGAADLVKYAAQIPARSDVDESIGAAIAFCGLESARNGEDRPWT